jgi:alcohol dehydrogenase (cytochrome c)
MADIEDLRAAFEQMKAFKLARLYQSFCFSALRSAPHVTKAKGRIMKMVLLTVTLLAVRPLAAHGQSAQDLKSDHQTPDNIYSHGMGYGLQRFSSLQQINRDTVKRLVPVWTYSLADNRGQETQPLVIDGVVYVTTHNSTAAIDTRTGKQIWKNTTEYPPETPRIVCCGIVNRGGAAYEGKLFRATLDAWVQALDLKTGTEVWKSQAADVKDNYSMTGAPLVANGVVITGIAGGDFGIRGFLDGWDPNTGKRLWRLYTIPAPGESHSDTWPGDTWKLGGASTWLTGSYDPDLDLVYWGTGNAGPWNAEFRKGDNLYSNSVLAVRPKTGELVWYYQFSPNDPYDYDGVNELVQADLTIDGKPRKVLMQANRNGFFYVLDRETGKLLRANPFVTVNWADRIDPQSGRPVESAATTRVRAGEKVSIYPSAFGGKNWSPMSYNPGTGLVYVNTLDSGWNYKMTDVKYRAGTFYWGIDFTMEFPEGPRGWLKAIDPLTGKAKWQFPSDIPMFGGTMTTAGGLVFSGAQTGELYAFDADTGDVLWKYQTGSGIIAPPVTYTVDGEQYVAVASGIGNVYTLFSGDERLAAVPTGGSITAFKLAK